jgi:hypothetical protein
MTFRHDTAGATKQPHQAIPRINGINRRARLIRSAGAIHLARGHAGDSNFRPFRTPDWAITIPHSHWRAHKSAARSDHANKC